MIAYATQSDGSGLIIVFTCAGLALLAVCALRDKLGVRKNAKRWWEL